MNIAAVHDLVNETAELRASEQLRATLEEGEITFYVDY